MVPKLHYNKARLPEVAKRTEEMVSIKAVKECTYELLSLIISD